MRLQLSGAVHRIQIADRTEELRQQTASLSSQTHDAASILRTMRGGDSLVHLARNDPVAVAIDGFGSPIEPLPRPF